MCTIFLLIQKKKKKKKEEEEEEEEEKKKEKKKRKEKEGVELEGCEVGCCVIRFSRNKKANYIKFPKWKKLRIRSFYPNNETWDS